MTATSNIHINLPGWSNATYAVGDRRYNGTNAYQCITAGTSTSPPTGTASDIAPGGVAHWKWLSAIDYTTLQAWADAIPSTLTQAVVGLLWNDNIPTVTAVAGTAILTLTGHTTSSTNTITLQPAPGEGFQDKYLALPTTAFTYNNANGVSIECPASGFGGINYLQVNDAYVRFKGLQFRDLNAASGATIIGGTGTNFGLSQCIVVGQTQSGGASMVQFGANNLSVTNCLLIDHDTAATGGTIGAQGATGVVIANNTFIQSVFITSKGACDAGSNGSTASNSATNNIFVNFDNVFFATSGIPWATNHNAYTNSTFFSGNATDTGGSIYNIVPANVFVGATTDFHLKTGSVCLNTGATDTTDIPTSIDIVNSSRPQGTSWDIGAHELLVGSTITRDFRGYFESKSIIQVDPGIATVDPFSSEFASEFGVGAAGGVGGFVIEWMAQTASPSRSIQVPLEWRNSVSLIGGNTQVQIEWLQSFPSLPDAWALDFSSDFGPSTPFVTDPVFALEFRSGLGAPTRDFPISIDWRSSLQRDIATPTDWRGATTTTYQIVTDWEMPQQRSVTTPIESRASISADRVSPFDFNRSLSANITVTPEWQGYAGLVVDTPITLEWRSVSVATATASVDFGNPLIASASFAIDWNTQPSRNYTVSIDTQAIASANRIAPITWVGSPISADTRFYIDPRSTVQIDAVDPVDTTNSVSQSSINQISYSGTLTRDVVIYGDTLISKTTDITVGLEIGGGSSTGKPVDIIVSLDWQGGIVSDAVIGAEPGSGIIQETPFLASIEQVYNLSILSNFDWQSQTSGDYTLPVEWDHLLLTIYLDGQSTVEILSTVQGDSISPIQVNIGRRSIGSTLEPDEWECEHDS